MIISKHQILTKYHDKILLELRWLHRSSVEDFFCIRSRNVHYLKNCSPSQALWFCWYESTGDCLSMGHYIETLDESGRTHPDINCQWSAEAYSGTPTSWHVCQQSDSTLRGQGHVKVHVHDFWRGGVAAPITCRKHGVCNCNATRGPRVAAGTPFKRAFSPNCCQSLTFIGGDTQIILQVISSEQTTQSLRLLPRDGEHDDDEYGGGDDDGSDAKKKEKKKKGAVWLPLLESKLTWFTVGNAADRSGSHTEETVPVPPQLFDCKLTNMGQCTYLPGSNSQTVTTKQNNASTT